MMPDKKDFSQIELKLLIVAYGFFHEPFYAEVIELKDALLHMHHLIVKFGVGVLLCTSKYTRRGN